MGTTFRPVSSVLSVLGGVHASAAVPSSPASVSTLPASCADPRRPGGLGGVAGTEDRIMVGGGVFGLSSARFEGNLPLPCRLACVEVGVRAEDGVRKLDDPMVPCRGGDEKDTVVAVDGLASSSLSRLSMPSSSAST